MATPQDNGPQNPQGTTRIVAGQSATPKPPIGLKVGINGIFDLTALNEVTGEKTSAAGLGNE